MDLDSQSMVLEQRNQMESLLLAEQQEPAQGGEHSPWQPFPKDRPLAAVVTPGQRQVPSSMEGEQQKQEPVAVLHRGHRDTEK